MSTEKADRTGFTIDDISAIRQVCVMQEPENDESSVRHYAWNWRFTGRGKIEVFFAITLGPREGYPFLVEVALVGTFRLRATFNRESIETLVTLTGPSILIPFIREQISSLTDRSPGKRILIPPIPMRDLRANLKVEDGEGVQQLEEDPSLARAADDEASHEYAG